MRKKYIRLLFILNMPILSAFLTLLHYGGLLKITGMTAYSLLYVLSIKKLIESAGEFKRYRYQGYQYD